MKIEVKIVFEIWNWEWFKKNRKQTIVFQIGGIYLVHLKKTRNSWNLKIYSNMLTSYLFGIWQFEKSVHMCIIISHQYIFLELLLVCWIIQILFTNHMFIFAVLSERKSEMGALFNKN